MCDPSAAHVDHMRQRLDLYSVGLLAVTLHSSVKLGQCRGPNLRALLYMYTLARTQHVNWGGALPPKWLFL